MKTELNFIVPEDYVRLESLPDDPPGSIAFGKAGENFEGLLMVKTLPFEMSMPFDRQSEVMLGVTEHLAEDQGLVEVRSGISAGNRRFVYSIIKTKLEPSGVQYGLTMHFEEPERVVGVNAFFDEVGLTGARDSTVLQLMVKEKLIELPQMEGWFLHPYIPEYKKGFLMNLSEDPKYDQYFPGHPLTQMRALVQYLVERN